MVKYLQFVRLDWKVQRYLFYCSFNLSADLKFFKKSEEGKKRNTNGFIYKILNIKNIKKIVVTLQEDITFIRERKLFQDTSPDTYTPLT